MEDAALQQIRAARLAELQAGNATTHGRGAASSNNAGAGGSGTGSGGGGEDESAMRHHQLSQFLDSQARDRLRRIALVKPDRARQIEDLIIRMAKSGQIRQRVTEPELVALLQQISGQQEAEKTKSGGIRHMRKMDDSDDDW